MPLVSVIMINYNNSKFLSEAIESVLNQTFRDFELIIVDDCSTDNSLFIINSYAQKDLRVKVLKNEVNSHIVFSRNRGIKESKGKYVFFIDSDDLYMPDCVKKNIDFFDKNEDCGLCGTWSMLIDENSEPLGLKKYPVNDQEIRYRLFFYNPLRLLAIRRSCFDSLGLLDDSFRHFEDLEFLFRISKRYKLHNLPEVLTRYRLHGDNAVFTKQKEMIKGVLQLRKEILKYYKQPLTLPIVISFFLTWLAKFLPVSWVEFLFQFFRKRL